MGNVSPDNNIFWLPNVDRRIARPGNQTVFDQHTNTLYGIDSIKARVMTLQVSVGYVSGMVQHQTVRGIVFYDQISDLYVAPRTNRGIWQNMQTI